MHSPRLASLIVVTSIVLVVSCSRVRYAKSSCSANLNQIEGAKATWALEHHKNSNDVPTDSDLFGPDRYIREKPLCTRGGTYTIGKVGDLARCSVLMHSLEAGVVYVVSQSGLPITEAAVTLPRASGYGIDSQTDSNGVASINPWADGATFVLVSKTGYVAATFALTNSWPARITLRKETE